MYSVLWPLAPNVGTSTGVLLVQLVNKGEVPPTDRQVACRGRATSHLDLRVVLPPYQTGGGVLTDKDSLRTLHEPQCNYPLTLSRDPVLSSLKHES